MGADPCSQHLFYAHYSRSPDFCQGSGFLLPGTEGAAGNRKSGEVPAPKRRACFCCCIQDLKKHCPNGQVFEICLTSYNVYFKNCAKSCKTPKKTLAISKNSSIIKARNPTGLQRIFFGKRWNLCIKSVFCALSARCWLSV